MVAWAVDAHRPRLGNDLEDGAHENVGDEGNAQEAVEHGHEVEAGPCRLRPGVLIDERQEQATVAARVIVQLLLGDRYEPSPAHFHSLTSLTRR